MSVQILGPWEFSPSATPAVISAGIDLCPGHQESGPLSLKTCISWKPNGANEWQRRRGMTNGLIHTRIHSALMGFSQGTHTTGQIRLHLMLCKMITSISGGIYSIAELGLWLWRKDLLLFIANCERCLCRTCIACARHLCVHISLEQRIDHQRTDSKIIWKCKEKQSNPKKWLTEQNEAKNMQNTVNLHQWFS